nr:MAG: hypothetical protein [Chemarfal virus 263]
MNSLTSLDPPLPSCVGNTRSLRPPLPRTCKASACSRPTSDLTQSKSPFPDVICRLPAGLPSRLPPIARNVPTLQPRLTMLSSDRYPTSLELPTDMKSSVIGSSPIQVAQHPWRYPWLSPAFTSPPVDAWNTSTSSTPSSHTPYEVFSDLTNNTYSTSYRLNPIPVRSTLLLTPLATPASLGSAAKCSCLSLTPCKFSPVESETMSHTSSTSGSQSSYLTYPDLDLSTSSIQSWNSSKTESSSQTSTKDV